MRRPLVEPESARAFSEVGDLNRAAAARAFDFHASLAHIEADYPQLASDFAWQVLREQVYLDFLAAFKKPW